MAELAGITEVGTAIAKSPVASQQTGETVRAGISTWFDITKMTFISLPLIGFGVLIIIIALIYIMIGDYDKAVAFLVLSGLLIGGGIYVSHR